MKRIIAAIIIFTALFFCACGKEIGKKPTEEKDATWKSDGIIEFSVRNGEIVKSAVTDSNGNSVNAAVTFSDDGTIYVSRADGGEKLFSGNCKFEKGKVTVTVTDIYSTEFSHLPVVFMIKRT